VKKNTWQTTLILLTLSALLVIGCNQSGTGTDGENTTTGKITISGAWALYPLVVRWGEEYQKLYPEVELDISAGGAGKGMADALADAVDIGMVSREIYPEEIDKGAFWVTVTKDAVFLTVSKNNPVLEDLMRAGVSRQQLVGIYITGEITNWGQLVGRPEVVDAIHVFTRSDACGAAATWAEYLDNQQEDLLGVGVYGDPGVLEAVIKDPLGIGYNNLNYAFDFQTGQPVSGARVVPLDANGNGKADPEEVVDAKAQAITAVAAGNYPSPPARGLNLVTKGKPTGRVSAFIKWTLTDGQAYVDEVGYITLTDSRLNAELQKLD
jgi:phosphate transport system substrate-binding protein